MHIKIVPSILMSMLCALLQAQEPSEIIVFDLSESDGLITLSNPVNVSSNQGYDNQPAFSEDGAFLLFSSERNGQTDIAQYNLQEKYRTWVTDTPDSEYSPAPYPRKKKNFTCVRLNQDGTQLLYKYSYKNKEPEVIIPGIRVGYYHWFTDKILVSFVIGEIETLQVSNLRYKIRYPIERNPGRSFQRIPATANGYGGNLCYINLEHGGPEIYAIDPENYQQQYIADALEGSQDLVWTREGTMLMGNEEAIYQYDPNGSKQWTPVKMEGDMSLRGFSRMAVSPDGRKIAVVVSE